MERHTYQLLIEPRHQTTEHRPIAKIETTL